MLSMNAQVRFLVTSLALAACALVVSNADAVGTRRFILDSLKSLEGGDLKGTSITSNGEVRAGLSLANLEIPDASSVWSAIVLKDGTVLLGTGNGGRIYAVKNGKASIAAETGALAVSALAIGFGGDVIAGTFPEGKLFRFPQGKLNGEKLKPWSELKETEDVWSLAFDDKKNALYAATGPEGKLFRIGPEGRAEVHFDSEDSHLVSVAVGPDSTVYAGSNGKALLYKISAPGRATVMHDFEGDDVKAIIVDAKGVVYAIANSYEGALKGLRPKRSSSSMSAQPSDDRSSRPGKGRLVRFDSRGIVEVMLAKDDTHFVALALDASGVPHVGTGAEGRVYSVDENHIERLVADTEERQVAALALSGPTRFVASSDPVVFHNITGVGGADAVWTSKVLDAGMRAQFGMLEWQGEGTLELETRSGNTDKPDDSWSAWSRPMAKPAKVVSPASRYLQIRARFSRDPKAVLREVKVAFVTDNVRALVTDVSAGADKSDTGSSSVPESGGPLGEPSTKIEMSWKVENPDNDKLRYRLFYKPIGGANWFSIVDSEEELTKPSYSWDTNGLPEGHYRVRVDASDELSNPPDRVTRHSLESRTIIVDNTPPQLTKLTLAGTRLQGTASDGIGPIARIEFQVVGGKSWFPVFPTDSVFDTATESFDVDVSNYVPTGPHLVVVRACDSGGNSVSRTVSRGK